jgi:hypothetical protein
MARLLKGTLRSALATVVIAAPAHESNAQVPADRFQKVVQPYVDAQMFSGSALVAKNRKILFSKSYGLLAANREIENHDKYDYVLVNNSLEECADKILRIVLSEQQRRSGKPLSEESQEP